jgi:hypothetical protein
MNWQIILLSWALIHAPIALGIGRALKKQISFADEPQAISGMAASPSSSPLPACGSRRPFPSNMKSTLASETRVDSATSRDLTDHPVAVADQFQTRFA